MGMTFVPLGVGDAFSDKYYSSCLRVSAGGSAILVDCPHPIRKMLREARGRRARWDLDDLDGVVLTHLHADHASGLEGYLYYSRFHLGRSGTIVAHREVVDRVWSGHLAAGMESIDSDDGVRVMSLDDYAAVHLLRDDLPLDFGPFQIECRKTKHHVPTFALKIHAQGRSLAYSADTAFDPELIKWLSTADTVIHETNRGIHTPYEALVALSEDVRRKMKLIHFPDDFDVARSVIEPLEQGREYAV